MLNEDKWLYEISAKHQLFSINYKEVWRYKDLIYMFVKREIVTYYKQTILGPLWFLIQPLITSFFQFLVFGLIAQIDSDGINYFLFALAGNVLWFYFSSCFTATSSTFSSNQAIFGKVYFPRIIMPISVTISNLIKFGIQFLVFIVFISIFYLKGESISIKWTAVFLPILILTMAILAMGFGMIISSMTTKYRDLNFLVAFGIQLYMYITPVVIPTSRVVAYLKPKGLEYLVHLNPLTSIFEFFKYSFLGKGEISVFGICTSLISSIIIFFIGLFIFNKTERTFIDTI